ncbi:hypothetical protein BW716_33740 [[Flexibacter] sp. ATCC 35208]|nr:hypothetical protein BW716_33740 [[Flexibacter] sp. ATCC 35208]
MIRPYELKFIIGVILLASNSIEYRYALKNMDIKTSIKEITRALRDRPKMFFLENPGYDTYKTYIKGFLLGLEAANDTKISLKMTLWFQKKLNIEARYHWTEMIPIHYKDKSDDELKAILLQTLIDYAEEEL